MRIKRLIAKAVIARKLKRCRKVIISNSVRFSAILILPLLPSLIFSIFSIEPYSSPANELIMRTLFHLLVLEL